MDLNRAAADDLVAVYALDALDPDEARTVDEALAVDPALADTAARLQSTAGWLGALEAVTPPPTLRARVLDAAVRRRAPGSSTTVAVSPPEAYAAQVERLAELLETLPPDHWTTPTAAGFTVHEVVAHLLAVEHYTASRLGIDPFEPPAGTDGDHVGMTLPTIDAHRQFAPAVTVEAWARRARATAHHLAGWSADDLSRRVELYGLDVSARSLLVARVFELWTHADDVRTAAGLAPEAPAPSTLALMSATAVRALPLGMLLAGYDAGGATAKVVLTGPGGGTWLQPLGGRPPAGGPDRAATGAPDVTVVADVVDFCRLAAQRLDPDGLRAEIEGDSEVARKVLVAAQVFAA